MRRALVMGALLCAACPHRHRDLNAPGLIDVHAPPARLELETVERPADPGEQMIVASFGAFGGGGWRFGGGDEGGGMGALGVEASVFYGCHFRSHNDDDFFIYPWWANGVNLGWTGVETGHGLGAVYVEAQASRELMGAAAGWAVDLDDERHGPQATVFVGPLYLRSTWLMGRGVDATAGLVFKWPAVWVWSR